MAKKNSNARSKRVANTKKAANRQKSESTVRDTDKVYVSDKTAEEQLENVRAKENKKFNYSEYMNAPITSVKYLDDNKFEIVVGAGGDYHYDDVYDNAAVELMNNTTFEVESIGDKYGHYIVKEAFGRTMNSDEDFEILDEKYRTLYEALNNGFISYSRRYDFTPKDFTSWVREVMRPMSITDKNNPNLKKAKQLFDNNIPFFTVIHF